jgi:hypothetical protein
VTNVLEDPTVAGIVNAISVTPELIVPGIEGLAVVAAETVRVLPSHPLTKLMPDKVIVFK